MPRIDRFGRYHPGSGITMDKPPGKLDVAEEKAQKCLNFLNSFGEGGEYDVFEPNTSTSPSWPSTSTAWPDDFPSFSSVSTDEEE